MTESLWTIPFGKYKGKDIEDIDEGYLKWLLEQDWFVQKFEKGAKAIAQELQYRSTFDIASEEGDEEDE